MRAIDADELVLDWEKRNVHSIPIAVIKKAPTIKVEPVRYGHWILNDRLIKSPWARNCHCSECSFEPMEQSSYCPNCGCKMRKGDE